MESMNGIWYQSMLQRLSYSKCQGNVKIEATSIAKFFYDCCLPKKKYLHSGRIGTEGNKHGFKNNPDAL